MAEDLTLPVTGRPEDTTSGHPTDMAASRGEDWMVPCDRGGIAFDDWMVTVPLDIGDIALDGSAVTLTRSQLERLLERAWEASRQRHTARLRRTGWLDQKGRVWTEVPATRGFDGGSLTPLLIDAREDSP